LGHDYGDLMAMAEWLKAEGVTHVAMESTGVYWKPVFNVLEDEFEVLLVNARMIKHVPGRKTDVADCQWIARLLQHGLLKGSFIPPRWQRELRDLTRQRAQLTDERSRTSNRIQKVLEDANVKLGSVASDVVGVSGRLMLKAFIAGQDDPQQLAGLAQRRLRNKIPQLEQALAGRLNDHHRWMLRLLLDQFESTEQ
jgi:transposase